METSAAQRASRPGAGRSSPCTQAASLVAPLTTIPTAAAASASPISRVATVSYLPWPKSCPSSCGRPLTRTNISTIKSVIRSDREWTASETIAALCAAIPAVAFRPTSSRFTTLPTRVTCAICCSRVLILRRWRGCSSGCAPSGPRRGGSRSARWALRPSPPRGGLHTSA